jgi:hypothetical protein
MDDENDDRIPNKVERVIKIERAGDNDEVGTFRAVLASEGEASDGHILSIRGMQVPDSMPMLFRHSSDGHIPALGRITNPEKTRIDGVASLRVTGAFDMGSGGDDDPFAAIRRGMAHMVRSGTLDAMSVRWDEVPGKVTARRNLPSDHPAFVDAQRDPDHPGVWGHFFDESIAREGSVVAIGADPAALMGRSQETDDPLEQTFWSALARSIEANSNGLGEIVAGFEAIQEQVENLRELGCSDADLVNAMGALSGLTPQDLVPCHYGNGQTLYVPREAWVQLRSEKSQEYWATLSLAGRSTSEATASAKETSREVIVEEIKEVVSKQVVPRVLGGEDLRSLIRETAEASVSRKIDQALGRISR